MEGTWSQLAAVEDGSGHLEQLTFGTRCTPLASQRSRCREKSRRSRCWARIADSIACASLTKAFSLRLAVTLESLRRPRDRTTFVDGRTTVCSGRCEPVGDADLAVRLVGSRAPVEVFVTGTWFCVASP